MVHENENLNIEEDVDYHILLDWTQPNTLVFAYHVDGKFICNGHFLWNRLRQVLAKFITGIQATFDFDRMQEIGHGSFRITCGPELGEIVPERKQKTSPIF